LARESDNDNGKWYKYVFITTHEPDTKSNPNSNRNRNPTTKQHAVVSIQLNVVACLETVIRDNRSDKSKHHFTTVLCHCHCRTLSVAFGAEN